MPVALCVQAGLTLVACGEGAGPVDAAGDTDGDDVATTGFDTTGDDASSTTAAGSTTGDDSGDSGGSTGDEPDDGTGGSTGGDEPRWIASSTWMRIGSPGRRTRVR